MEIRWSPNAFSDLEKIFHRIQLDNAHAAHEVTKMLYDGCTGLAEFPHRGRVGRLEGRRELVFPGLPYIVVYRIKEHVVEISRIYHSSQDWP